MPREKREQERPARLLELRLTKNASLPAWHLRGGGAGADVGLLGWVMDRAPVDAGVPTEVAGIVVRAVCRSQVLTFLYPLAVQQAESSTWTRAPWGWACVLRPAAFQRALGKTTFPIIATSDPATARELFRADGFDWDLEGQIVLLSAAGSAPPSLDYDHLERLFGNAPLNRAATRLPKEFTGLLVPGVDGDFLELVTFDDAVSQVVSDAIALECADAKVGYRIVSEAEFVATKWHG
jgi:hypothetical protein